MGVYRNTSHAISLLRECLDHQVLVILPPSIDFRDISDLRHDIFSNIVLVSSLVVKADAARRQWLETDADIHLWPTRGTYVQIRESEINKIPYKAENMFPRGSYARGIWAFI